MTGNLNDYPDLSKDEPIALSEAARILCNVPLNTKMSPKQARLVKLTGRHARYAAKVRAGGKYQNQYGLLPLTNQGGTLSVKPSEFFLWARRRYPSHVSHINRLYKLLTITHLLRGASLTAILDSISVSGGVVTYPNTYEELRVLFLKQSGEMNRLREEVSELKLEVNRLAVFEEKDKAKRALISKNCSNIKKNYL